VAESSVPAPLTDSGSIAPDLRSNDPARSGQVQAQQAKTSIWRSVRRDAILLGLGSVGVVVAQFGFRSLAIARLDPSAYGRLTLIISFYNTVMIIGASGLPNSASRYIAILPSSDDGAVVSAARKAAFWPVALATTIAAVAAGLVLKSPSAMVLSLFGMPSLVYSLLSTGILRGRGHVKWAASILPAGAVSQMALVGAALVFGVSLTPTIAFTCFCAGNCVGWLVGMVGTVLTAPARHAERATPELPSPSGSRSIPSPRELLAFSVWLATATIGVAVLPLIMRSIAVTDSYDVVAMIDIALVVLTIPQRVGVVLVQAVIPHATRALGSKQGGLTISPREYFFLIAPFAVGAGLIAFTPIVNSAFDLIGKSEYGHGGDYIALVLLAGPARILYGLVQGILVAHGEGRFLAQNAWSVTVVASALMIGAMALGFTLLAFGVFVVACWMVYWIGLWKLDRLPAFAGSPEAEAEIEAEAEVEVQLGQSI
jgi:O-antigen/teichoic acid export membrane protein